MMATVFAAVLLMSVSPSGAMHLNRSSEVLEATFNPVTGEVLITVPMMSRLACDIVYVFKDTRAGFSFDPCYSNNECRFICANGRTSCPYRRNRGELSSPGSVLSIPGIASLADGKYQAGFSNCQSDWNRGYAANLVGPPFQIASGSVVGDPHVVNMNHERFEIKAAGKHKLVQIPRFVGTNQTLQLRIDAVVEHLNDQKCNDTYIRELVLSGNWTHDFGRIQISAGSDAPNTTLRVNNQMPHALCKGLPSSKAKCGNTFMWLSLGETSFRITKHYEGRLGKQRGYLNLRMGGLKRFLDVGGILGHDDHTDAEKPPANCT